MEGLEKLIETQGLNQQLLRIVDIEKELATDIMKGEMAIEAYRDRKKIRKTISRKSNTAKDTSQK